MKILAQVSLVGGAYRNGRYCPGFAQATLDDGSTQFLGGEEVKGFDGAVEVCKARGIDTATFERKLDNWVKTGKLELPLTNDQKAVLEMLRAKECHFIAAATEEHWKRGEGYYIDSRVPVSRRLRSLFNKANEQVTA